MRCLHSIINWRFFTVFLIFILCEHVNARTIERPVRISASSERIRQIEKMVETVYQNVDFFFGPGSPVPVIAPLHIFVDDNPFSRSDYPLGIPLHLPENFNERQQVEAITRKVLAQRIRQIQIGQELDGQESGDHEWLVAALSNGIMQAYPERKIQLRPNYQPVDRVFRKGHFPDLKILLENPVSAKDPLLSDLYSMHCHILLSLIRGPAPQIWQRGAPPVTPARKLLVYAAQGEDPLSAVRKTVKELNTQMESVQLWYEKNAPDIARRSRQVFDYHRVLEELFVVLTVDPEKEERKSGDKVVAGEKNRITRKSLAEFDDKDFWTRNRSLIIKKQNHLLWLYPRTPRLLQPSIGIYLSALKELHNRGHSSRFRRLLRQGDRDMINNLAKQRELEKRLEKAAEKNPFSSPHLDSRLFDIIIDSQKRTRQMAPEIYELLDKSDQ